MGKYGAVLVGAGNLKGNALNDWSKPAGALSGCDALARIIGALVVGLWLGSAGGQTSARSPAAESTGFVRTADLPGQARETLALIKRGGPYPFASDGAVFANREGRLPAAARGTYREYTVTTPGRHDRGARRIIAAEPDQFWYTADHYRTFRRIVE